MLEKLFVSCSIAMLMLMEKLEGMSSLRNELC